MRSYIRAHEDMERLFDNPELVAMAFQLLLQSADRLAGGFTTRLGTEQSDARPKLLAYAALGAVLISLEEWIVGDLAEPQRQFVDHIEILRPVLV